MAVRFTKEQRQNIVREFAIRHNGVFNPRLFLDEVRRVGEEHPAFGWFEWDQEKAALAWQVEQARDFARDLRVTFKVEEFRPASAVRVVTREMPLVLSPIDHRHHGSGYVLTNPENPDHMREHCRQAAQALGAWIGRYASAVEHIGGSLEPLDSLSKDLAIDASRAN